MREWAIRIGILLVIGLGAFIFRDRLSSNAGELAVGDCFDDPQSTGTVTDVQHHPCNESHTAEVIFLGKLPEATTYPTDLSVQDWVGANCVPAWEAFTGKEWDIEEVLTIGFYQPTSDGWSSGDRDVVCYTIRNDSAPMTTSVKKS
jgi:hypothetical protein